MVCSRRSTIEEISAFSIDSSATTIFLAHLRIAFRTRSRTSYVSMYGHESKRGVPGRLLLVLSGEIRPIRALAASPPGPRSPLHSPCRPVGRVSASGATVTNTCRHVFPLLIVTVTMNDSMLYLPAVQSRKSRKRVTCDLCCFDHLAHLCRKSGTETFHSGTNG